MTHLRDEPASASSPRHHRQHRRASTLDALTASRFLPALSGPLLYVAASFAMTANTWTNPTRTIVGYGGDPLSFVWDLQWPTFAIAHGYNPFFTHYIIAPQGVNLMWGASMGPGIILAPLIFLLGPAVVYNLMATLSLALSAWLGQLAIYRLVPSRLAAIIGGLIFGFSPYMMGHAWGHVTITLAFLPPLMLILLHETLVRQRWPWWVTGVSAGLLIAIQYITFIETIAITLLASGILIVLLAAQRFSLVRARAGYAIRASATMVLTFFAAAAYPLSTMLYGTQRLSSGTVQPPDLVVTDLLNFIVPTFTTRFVPGFLASTSFRVGDGVESGAYLGIPIIAICLFTTILLWRQIVVRTAALAGLILAVLSLGPRLHIDGHIFNVPLPFAAITHIPLFDNILASRIMGVADLCVAVLVAAFVAKLTTVRAPWRAGGLAVLALGIFLIVPSPLPLPDQPYVIPSYFTTAAVKQIPSGSMVLVAPFDTNGTQDSPQDWQAASGFRFRMPEGYAYVRYPGGATGTGPVLNALSAEMTTIYSAPATAAVPQISPSERVAYLAQLRAWHTTTVLVGPMSNYKVMVAFFQRLLSRSGETQGGVTAWYHVGS